MKGFKHLVEMHKKYADKGLVILTVSIDDEEEFMNVASKFLKKQDPPFGKFLLDEPRTFWEKKLGFATPPCYFIFDRNGRWVRYIAAEFETNYYELMDKDIIRMLNEK